jgi:spermidine/putrescine transport system substrate-binding protein
VLDAFTEEFGVTVTYLTYETQREARANITAGNIYDVVVMDNYELPQLISAGLLAEIDYNNVPNFQNIAPNFKDLAYDPQNKFSVPFNWGTTGILVRADMVTEPVTHWADLRRLSSDGKIAMRDEHRDQIGSALKALGYSANTENADELEDALQYMGNFRDRVIFVDGYAEAVIPLLANGEAVALIGWADDAFQGREASPNLAYILPEDGPLLWGDNFVIPANSPNKYTAELFLNFVLRPEISAEITNENYYATPNEAARAFIKPEILNDPVVFPTEVQMKNAEVLLPLSPEGEALFQHTWKRFKAAGQ